MNKRNLFTKITAISIMLSCLICTNVFASTGISRECFYTTNGLNYDQQINDFLVGDGYDAINDIDDSSASNVRSNMPSSDVFYISTHGLDVQYNDGTHTYGGAVACFNSSGENSSTLSADETNDNNNYSLEGLWGDSGSQLSNINLAYFSACYSAQTSSYYGNLLDRTVSLGAKSSIGFYNSVGITQSKYFDDRFFYHALDDKEEVSTAAYNALMDAREAYGQDTAGVESCVIAYGSSNESAYIYH